MIGDATTDTVVSTSLEAKELNAATDNRPFIANNDEVVAGDNERLPVTPSSGPHMQTTAPWPTGIVLQ